MAKPVSSCAADLIAALMKHDSLSLADLVDYTGAYLRTVQAHLAQFEGAGVIVRVDAPGTHRRARGGCLVPDHRWAFCWKGLFEVGPAPNGHDRSALTRARRSARTKTEAAERGGLGGSGR